MDWKKEVLDLIADMKVAADKPRCDQLNQLASDIISQDCRPFAMADNLEYWLKLTDRECRPAAGLGDMDVLIEETKDWDFNNRVTYIRAYMAGVYARIHKKRSRPDADNPVSSGPDFTQEQIDYMVRQGWIKR